MRVRAGIDARVPFLRFEWSTKEALSAVSCAKTPLGRRTSRKLFLDLPALERAMQFLELSAHHRQGPACGIVGPRSPGALSQAMASPPSRERACVPDREDVGSILLKALREASGLRGALRRLLNRLERDTDQGGPSKKAELCRSVAALYGMLGYGDDATDWLRRSQQLGDGSESPEIRAGNEILKAGLAYLSGDYTTSIHLANHALKGPSRRATESVRILLLTILGASYLRLGQFSKAELCVIAIHSQRARPNADLGTALGWLLEGELNLWSVLRAAPCFRGQVLFAGTLRGVRIDRPFHLRQAQNAFERASECSREHHVLRVLAECGLIRTRLLATSRRIDWERLKEQVQLIATYEIAHERDLARLNLAVLYLIHDMPQEARSWLAPLANSAMQRLGSPFEHEILFCAASAAKGCGDARQAFCYLSEYNARICAQHFSHRALPPPFLEHPRTPPRAAPSVLSGCDKGLVERIAALVREWPATPAHSLQLAAIEGISRRTLEYKIRQATGQSPKEFVTAIRLEMAYAALEKLPSGQSKDLAALAQSTGFATYRSFLRCFRTRYGLSPGEMLRLRGQPERGRVCTPSESDKTPDQKSP